MPTYTWQQLMDAADEATFQVWPAGEYEVEVAAAEAVKTKSGDKDMIKVQFKALSGPMKGKGNCFSQFVISPENQTALSFFFRHMRALGLDQEFFKAGPAMPQVAKALVGRRARIKVEIRQWNEQDQNDVKNVLPPLPSSTGGSAPVAPPAPASSNGVPNLPSSSGPVTPPAPPAPPTPPAPSEPPAPPTPPAPAEPAPSPEPAEPPPAPRAEDDEPAPATDGPKLPF